METDQDWSTFERISGANPADKSQEFSGNFFNVPSWINRMLNRIENRLHEALDKVSARAPLAVYSNSSNKNSVQVEAVFKDTLSYLCTKGFIKKYWIRDIRYNDAPVFYALDIWPAYPHNITDGSRIETPFGHGFGKTKTLVFTKALGEFLERYPLTLYKNKELLRGSFEAMKKKGMNAMDINQLAGFSEEQKNRSHRLRFNGQSEFRWCKTQRPSYGETVYIPAQLIYWNYQLDDEEPMLSERNTSGCGGMFTKERAILSGLYELIQRDAFLRIWLTKKSPKRIDPTSIPHNGIRSMLAEASRYKFEIYFLDITSDIGVPSVIAVVDDPSERGPRFVIGGGCEANPIYALQRALEEAWSVYYWIRPKPNYQLPTNYQSFITPVNQAERLQLWANPIMAQHFKYLLTGSQISFSDLQYDYPRSFASETEELEYLIGHVERFGAGYEVYVYLPAWDILRRVGYSSARVIVPRLLRLYLDERNAPLGAERISELENLLPHPFP